MIYSYLIDSVKNFSIYIIGCLLILLLSTKLYYVKQENIKLENTLKSQQEVNSILEKQLLTKNTLNAEIDKQMNLTKKKKFINTSQNENLIIIADSMFKNFYNEN